MPRRALLRSRESRGAPPCRRSSQRQSERHDVELGSGLLQPVSCTASAPTSLLRRRARPSLALRREHVERALRGRRGHPLFLIDLAVPRDLDPAINELDGCYLYDIDDLEAVVADARPRRREAAAGGGDRRREAEQFRAWQASLDVVPAIASLRARAEEIRSRSSRRRSPVSQAFPTRSGAPSSR